jgi:hypothetical protein
MLACHCFLQAQASILAQAKIDTQMLGAHIEHTRTPTHQNSSQH